MVYLEVISDIQYLLSLTISWFFIYNEIQGNIVDNYFSIYGYLQQFSHYSLHMKL